MDNIISLEEVTFDEELFNDIIEKIKGKPFFAVSFNPETNRYIRHEYYMTNEQMIYGCECLKFALVYEDLL